LVVGSFRDIVFETDLENEKRLLRVPENIASGVTATWVDHARLLNTPVQEFTGWTADDLTFDMLLRCDLGIDLFEAVALLTSYVRDGKAGWVVLGPIVITRYPVILANLKMSVEKYAPTGDIISYRMGCTFKQYTMD
jgi:hypothetical protein